MAGQDRLLTAQDHVIYLNAADVDPVNRASRTNEKYGMMIVLEEATVTFKTTWKLPDGTLAEFTDKVLQPGNYPRTIYDVTITSGEIWLLV